MDVSGTCDIHQVEDKKNVQAYVLAAFSQFQEFECSLATQEKVDF